MPDEVPHFLLSPLRSDRSVRMFPKYNAEPKNADSWDGLQGKPVNRSTGKH